MNVARCEGPTKRFEVTAEVGCATFGPPPSPTVPAMPGWPPRPELRPEFFKAHGLGNDYLVFESGPGWIASPETVRAVCDRHRGVGSDGLVAMLSEHVVVDGSNGATQARMFNPDGGEFERSGNGLRVLGAFLAERHPTVLHWRIEVGGGVAVVIWHGSEGAAHDLSVDFGRARTGAAAVDLDPGALEPDGSLRGPAGELLAVVPVSVGNPHLVVFADYASELGDGRLDRLGPHLVGHPALAAGANVQLVWVDPDAGACSARIWERGVGPTASSGSSACAVVAAAVHAGRMAPGAHEVHMPGGTMTVEVTAALDVVLRAPVEEVCRGSLTPGFLEGTGVSNA